MKEKALHRLRRSELLEILVRLSEENEALTAECDALRKQIEDRTIRLERAGSIAEAALQLNYVFEAAQNAAAQYLENITGQSSEQQVLEGEEGV